MCVETVLTTHNSQHSVLNCLQIFRIVQLASSEPAFKHMVSMVANEVRVVKLCRLLKLGKLVELIDPQKLSTLLAAALEPLGIHGVVRRLSRTTQARLVLLPWAVTISRHLTCNLTSTRADLPEHVVFRLWRRCFTCALPCWCSRWCRLHTFLPAGGEELVRHRPFA